MPKFRKKPVVIEAVRYHDNPEMVVPALWLAKAYADGVVYAYGKETLIKTLEGDMRVSDGDYIIRGTQGEIYPCKPKAFADTFEPVGDSEGRYKLSFETPEGKRSGLAFKKINYDDSDDTFLFTLGCALTALYRYEYQKCHGVPPRNTLFNARYTLGCEPNEVKDAVMKSIIETEEANRDSYRALEKYINAKFEERSAKCDTGCSDCGNA